MFINSLVTNGGNISWEVDHIKFRTQLVEGLLVKLPVQHKVPGHSDGDKAVHRLTVLHFSRKATSHIKEM